MSSHALEDSICEAELTLKDQSVAHVHKLTPRVASLLGQDLARIHNEIPFQNWTPSEIAAESIDGRHFRSKWDLSHIAVVGDRAVALNLAYERPASVTPYPEDCIYMHRFAVDPAFRSVWLGRLFHAHALDVAFHHRPAVLSVSDPPLYGQTQATLENAHVLRFYVEGCRFTPVGFMYYADKVDVVLRLDRDDFYRGPHWLALARRRRFPEQSHNARS